MSAESSDSSDDDIVELPLSSSCQAESGSNSSKSNLIVTCGSLKGRLILDKFLCPGIHAPCIKIDSRFLSPKQFAIQAGYEKTCEWRHVISHQNLPLREIMDRGSLEFFNHANLCSGLCNLSIPNMCNDGRESSEQNARNTQRSVVSSANISPTMSYAGQQSNKIVAEEIEVTCNDINGRLLLSEFVCPGINEKCILLEGLLLSPKEFVFKGRNEKMNGAWKRMIKYKGNKLGYYMERKELDFYNHNNFCSGQCKQNPYNTKTNRRYLNSTNLCRYLDRERGPFVIIKCGGQSVGKFFLELFRCPGFTAYCIDQKGKMMTMKEFVVSSLGVTNSETRQAIKVDGVSLKTRMFNNEIEFYQHDQYCSKRCNQSMKFGRNVISSLSDGSVTSGNNQELDPEILPIVINDSNTIEEEMTQPIDYCNAGQEYRNTTDGNLPLFRDPVKFWISLKKLGLIDEFLKDILTKISQCKMTLFNPEIESDPQLSLEVCRQLSLTVGSLGLSNQLMNKLKQQQNLYQNSAQRLRGDVEALQRLAEDQEARRREALRKRALYEQLMTETSTEQSSSSNSLPVTPVSDDDDGPPVKEAKIENLTENARSMFDI